MFETDGARDHAGEPIRTVKEYFTVGYASSLGVSTYKDYFQVQVPDISVVKENLTTEQSEDSIFVVMQFRGTIS